MPSKNFAQNNTPITNIPLSQIRTILSYFRSGAATLERLVIRSIWSGAGSPSMAGEQLYMGNRQRDRQRVRQADRQTDTVQKSRLRAPLLNDLLTKSGGSSS